MDAHHFYDYGVTGSDLSYSSYPTISSLPNRLPGASKFDSENSPISPLANYLDSETFTTLSDCQEQHSSTENLSGASSSSNSSLDYNHYFHRPSPSPDCLPEGLLVLSGGNAVLQNAVHSQNMQRALLQLESALMGPDEEVTKSSPSYGGNKAAQTSSQRSRTWTNESKVLHQNETQRSQISLFITRSGNGILSQERDKVLDDLPLHGVPSNNLKQLLIACARVLAENKLDDFEVLITKARTAVSITGDPIQRLGAYILEGLVARKELSGTTIYRSLRCKEPAGNDLLSYMHILYEICPYLKFGYMAANGAIAEACRNENYVHIIDFQIAQGTQWMTLLQALAARPGGAPYVRITGIDDPVSQYARGDGLAAVEKRLSAISEKFNIAVEFNAVPVFAPEVTKAMLDVRPGEAVAVNFPLQLHHIPDESVDVNNPRDELIRMIKSLCPKIVTLVEQESNTNTAPFFPRFLEALDYYHAMFESIDVTLARDRKERINVEQHCLARDIVNVIACEGKERVERHELLGKWKSRFMMAGFRQYPLSSYVNSVIKDLMRRYSEHYTLVEKDGAMLLGWKERNLISASAWY